MLALTPSERRAALIVVLLFGLGAARDLWRSSHPRMRALAPGPITDAAPVDAGPSGPGSPSGAAPPDSPAQVRNRIDLNRASASELDELPGVGPVLAARIIEHRSRHGRFRSVDDLRAVRGFGPKLMLRVRDHVTTGPDSSLHAIGEPARERVQSALERPR